MLRSFLALNEEKLSFWAKTRELIPFNIIKERLKDDIMM